MSSKFWGSGCPLACYQQVQCGAYLAMSICSGYKDARQGCWSHSSVARLLAPTPAIAAAVTVSGQSLSAQATALLRLHKQVDAGAQCV